MDCPACSTELVEAQYSCTPTDYRFVQKKDGAVLKIKHPNHGISAHDPEIGDAVDVLFCTACNKIPRLNK